MGAVSQPVKRHIYSVNKYLSLQAQMISNELSETLVCLLQRARDFVIFLKLCKLKFISKMLNKYLVFDHKMHCLGVTDCSEHWAFRNFIPSLLMQLFFLPWASLLLQWCGGGNSLFQCPIKTIGIILGNWERCYVLVSLQKPRYLTKVVILKQEALYEGKTQNTQLLDLSVSYQYQYIQMATNIQEYPCDTLKTQGKNLIILEFYEVKKEMLCQHMSYNFFCCGLIY